MSGNPNTITIWPRKAIKLFCIGFEFVGLFFVGAMIAFCPLALLRLDCTFWTYLFALPFQFVGLILSLATLVRFVPSFWFTLRSTGPSFSLSDNGIMFHHLPGKPTLPWRAISATKPMGSATRVIAILLRDADAFHSTFTADAKMFLAHRASSWNWCYDLYPTLSFYTWEADEPELRQINLTDLLGTKDGLGFAITISWFDVNRPVADLNRVLLTFLHDPDLAFHAEAESGFKKLDQDIRKG